MNKIDKIPPYHQINKGDEFELNHFKAHATHSFFKYPARFIPEIPNWAIRNFTKPGDSVLDCFAGSGTSLVEASIEGRKPYAIDSDPLSNLLCKVKTRHISKRETEELIVLVGKILLIKSDPWVPELKNLDHWFPKKNIRQLGIIASNINTLCEKNQKYKEFFLAVLASIIRECSYADIQSPKPYVSRTHPRIPTEPKKIFKKRVEKFLKVFDQKRFLGKVTKISGNNALDLNTSLLNQFNLVVTSPPYTNAFDYVRVLRLENLWLNLLSQDDLEHQRELQVGNESIKAQIYNSELPLSGIKNLDITATKIFEIDRKRAHVVLQYFEQMSQNLRVIHKYLKKNSYYVCVVGNSDIAGIEVNVLETLSEIGLDCKFEVENSFSYKIKNPYLRIPRNGKGGLIKMDHVLVMKKR